MSNRILSIGSQFPAFKKKAVVSTEKGKEFAELTSIIFQNNIDKVDIHPW